MHSTRQSPQEQAKDPRFQLAQRVAQSAHLRNAPRLREFLLFVCEQTLLGQTENLTEQRLGPRIFGRPDDYNPAEDSIVRVQARQLRLRLAEYFQGEGREEKAIIEIPKGSYAAVFHENRAVHEFEPAAARAKFPYRKRHLLAAWALAAALAVACLFLYLDNRRLRTTGGRAGSPVQEGSPWLLAEVFENTEAATVVVGDPAFGNIKGMLGLDLSLEDYLRPGYPRSVLPPGTSPDYAHAFQTMTATPLSSFTHVVIAERLGKLAERYGWRYRLRHARDLTIRELARGNLVLFGTRMSNPWIELYDKTSAFPSYWDPQNKVVCFRNAAPLRGEPQVFASAGPNGAPGSAFAVVALLPGQHPSSESSRVLTVRGTKAEAIEAAWDFIADPRRMRERLTRAGFKPQAIEASPNFEILLETSALGDSHGDVVVRSLRLH